MTFKDIIKRDVQQTFLNVDEFSEIHTVNGKPMAVQIDNNEQIERERDTVSTWTEYTSNRCSCMYLRKIMDRSRSREQP